MSDILEVAEGIRFQDSDERRVYTITTTNVISDPTSPSVTVYDESTNTDVTSTVMPTNSPSASGDVITLSLLRGLTAGHSYRVEVEFTVSSQIIERYFRVKCPR